MFTYRKGVTAIVVDDQNKFLLIQKNGYKENEWNFLGGGREEGETLEQNLFRELKEEISANQSDFEFIGTSSFKIEYDYPPELALKVNGGKFRGQSYDQVILKYIGDKGKLVFTPEEFRTHKWVSASELIKHLVFPNQYQNHKKAIDELLPGLI
jgi:putative (di)nucleoside polyphosphate hydrolase